MAFTLNTVPADCQTGETYGNGRLGTMTDPSGSTKYCYDHRGNVVRKVQVVTIASTTRVVGYSYNHADALVAMTYPSGATVAYARDGNGRIVGVTVQPSAGATAATVISDVDYLPFGPINVLTFGNGRTLTRSYDLDYGIDAVTDSHSAGLSINLGLDVVGNVTSLAERKADGTTASRTVGYDAIDRLSSFNDGGTVVQGFTYDATGNRMSKTSGGSTAAYTYPSTSHLLTSGTGIRNYDAAGNSTYVAGRTYVYDDAGRRVRHILAGSTVREFAYNGHGERVARIITTSPANDQIMVYDEAGHLIGEYLKNGTRLREIVWMDDTPVAVLTTVGSSTYQYILTDHLNTPRQIVIPATNVTVWRWDIANTAFGDHAANQDPDGDGVNYGFFLRYPGQYYDEDSGLYYNYFRDYDPTSGRYLQSDPIGLAGGVTTFGYVSASPLGATDPLGLDMNWHVDSLRLKRENHAASLPLPHWIWEFLEVEVGNTQALNIGMHSRCYPAVGYMMLSPNFFDKTHSKGPAAEYEYNYGGDEVIYLVSPGVPGAKADDALRGLIKVNLTVSGGNVRGRLWIGDAYGTFSDVLGEDDDLPDGVYGYSFEGGPLRGSGVPEGCDCPESLSHERRGGWW